MSGVSQVLSYAKDTPVLQKNKVDVITGSKAYSKLLLHRLVDKKKLYSLKKGFYCLNDDIFLIASNIHFPSYISFLSASYYYNYTEKIPFRFYVATTKNYSPANYKNYTIEFVKLPHFFGYHKLGDRKEVLFMADKEKLLIDCFLKPECMGNFEEIETLFERVDNFDLEKLKHYLIKTDSNKIFRQVGFMLEKYHNIDISEFFQLNHNYYSLNAFRKCKTINKKWRLYIE